MERTCDNKEGDYTENIHSIGFWDIRGGVTLRRVILTEIEMYIYLNDFEYKGNVKYPYLNSITNVKSSFLDARMISKEDILDQHWCALLLNPPYVMLEGKKGDWKK